MALFTSTYVNRIDAKGRVSVPADFRRELGEQAVHGLYAAPSPKRPAIDCRPRAEMEEMLARLAENFDDFSDEQDDLAGLMFGESLPLSIDGDGRMMIPRDLVDPLGITDRIAFVGIGRHFQLWEPESWEAARALARERAKEKAWRVPPRPKGGGA